MASLAFADAEEKTVRAGGARRNQGDPVSVGKLGFRTLNPPVDKDPLHLLFQKAEPPDQVGGGLSGLDGQRRVVVRLSQFPEALAKEGKRVENDRW